MGWVKAFAIAPGQNSIGNDSQGAFRPGVHAFAKAYGCPWRLFENHGADPVVRQRVYDAIDAACPSDTNLFAYFGHGMVDRLPSAGIWDKDLDEFVEVLRPKVAFPLFVVLYACSSGAAGALTGKLREKLGGDVWVYGHTSVGHSFMNPDVSEETAANTPSWRMLYPSGAELRWAWSEALHYTDLWLRFPVMSDDAIAAELNARRLLGEWEVTGGGSVWRYVFDDEDGKAWTAASDRDPDEAPTGTVKAFDPKNRRTPADTGTWEITDKVAVSWASGETETWPLTLKTIGQQVVNGGTILTAKRLSHPFTHGKLQG